MRLSLSLFLATLLVACAEAAPSRDRPQASGGSAGQANGGSGGAGAGGMSTGGKGGSAGGGTGGAETGNFKNVVSQAQFEALFPRRNAFYTYDNLIKVTDQFVNFCSGPASFQVREAAAFLANVNHETQGLNYLEEACAPNCADYCDASNTMFPCAAGVKYYGRGPLQISYNYNYGPAGDVFGVNLLSQPYLLASDGLLTWKSALWYWMDRLVWVNGSSFTVHSKFTVEGFAGSVQLINGMECVPGNQQVQSRIDSYKSFLSVLGGTDSGDLDCRS